MVDGSAGLRDAYLEVVGMLRTVHCLESARRSGKKQRRFVHALARYGIDDDEIEALAPLMAAPTAL